MRSALPSVSPDSAAGPGAVPVDPGTAVCHQKRHEITRPEAIFLALSLVLAIAIRVRYASQISFNSDEPQHLHVVWAWATGRLPYREVFDNHAPLFHLLLSPVLRLLGERPDVLVWMRLAMLPLYLASLIAIFGIGRAVFSVRIGLWAAAFAAIAPELILDKGRVEAASVFFFKMGEFRTDVLWSTFWLLSLAVVLSGDISPKRCFFFGLVLGAAMAVSMKTILMLFALAVAASVVLVAKACFRERVGVKESLQSFGAAALGFLVIPSAVILLFALRGGLPDMYRCVIQHNTMPHTGIFDRAHHHIKYLVERFSLLFALAGAIVYWTPRDHQPLRRAFLIVAAGSYYLGVCGFWPIITPQDFQPSDPLFALCLTPVLFAAGGAIASKFSRSWLGFGPIAAAIVISFVLIFRQESLFQYRTRDEVAMLRDVLRLTRPNEVIFDAKGECIYRPRSWYMVLETIARKKIQLGLLKDDLVEKTISAGAPLAHGLERIQVERDRSWFDTNYLQVGHVLVLGKLLGTQSSDSLSFETVIPERYCIVADHGVVQGTLDGVPFAGPVALAPGWHQFKPEIQRNTSRYAVLWARAVEKGYTPFGQVPPES